MGHLNIIFNAEVRDSAGKVAASTIPSNYDLLVLLNIIEFVGFVKQPIVSLPAVGKPNRIGTFRGLSVVDTENWHTTSLRPAASISLVSS